MTIVVANFINMTTKIWDDIHASIENSLISSGGGTVVILVALLPPLLIAIIFIYLHRKVHTALVPRMKKCMTCCKDLPEKKYSKKQWKCRQYRRCKECIDIAIQQDTIKKPFSYDDVVDDDDDAPSCWICLSSGLDKDGNPIRRDCSCRGTDSGYAHTSCLIKYMTSKTHSFIENSNTSPQLYDYGELNSLWTLCQCCKQPHQNELAVELSCAFVSLVDQRYEIKYSDTYHKLCSIVKKLEGRTKEIALLTIASARTKYYLKIEALSVNQISYVDMVGIPNLSEGQKLKAMEAAKEMLSLIKQLKEEDDEMNEDYVKLPDRVRALEGEAHTCLGNIALAEETEESVKRAISHFKNCLDVYEEIGFDAGILVINNVLASAKDMLSDEEDSCISDEVKVKQMCEEYESSVEHHGGDAIHTLNAGCFYAVALANASQYEEANKLIEELAARSTRAHGETHRMTKSIKSDIKYIRRAAAA